MLTISETSPVMRIADVDVRIIGVGGAGCSSLNRLSETMSSRANMLGIDTGSATQFLSFDIESLAIGNGFGSGGNPETALEMFEEAELGVADFIGDADVVIILAGLGRGTGSGLSPRVAEIARNSGALTIAAVNMPFEFEGRFRNQSASRAHEALKNSADSVITMNNDDLSRLGESGASMNGAFQLADMNIASAVHAITTALESSTERFITVQQSLSQAGESAVLSGAASGLHAGSAAVANAFSSTSSDFARVRSIVVHVEGGIGLSLGQVAEAVAEIRTIIGRRTEIHVSSERRVGLGQEIDVTLVLAGVELREAIMETTTNHRHSETQHDIPNVPIFETQTPRRTRGPVLLPTG